MTIDGQPDEDFDDAEPDAAEEPSGEDDLGEYGQNEWEGIDASVTDYGATDEALTQESDVDDQLGDVDTGPVDPLSLLPNVDEDIESDDMTRAAKAETESDAEGLPALEWETEPSDFVLEESVDLGEVDDTAASLEPGADREDGSLIAAELDLEPDLSDEPAGDDLEPPVDDMPEEPVADPRHVKGAELEEAVQDFLEGNPDLVMLNTHGRVTEPGFDLVFYDRAQDRVVITEQKNYGSDERAGYLGKIQAWEGEGWDRNVSNLSRNVILDEALDPETRHAVIDAINESRMDKELYVGLNTKVSDAQMTRYGLDRVIRVDPFEAGNFVLDRER